MSKLTAFIVLSYLSMISAGFLPHIKRAARSRTIKNINSSPLKPITGMQEYSQYVNRPRRRNKELPLIYDISDRIAVNQILKQNDIRNRNDELNKIIDNFSLVQKLSPIEQKFRKPDSVELQGKSKLDNIAVVLVLANSDRHSKNNGDKVKNTLTNIRAGDYGLNDNLNDFDDRGRIFLTQPKDIKHRNLNKLLDKVVNYTYDKKHLRSPVELFSKGEIEELKVILKAMKESRKSNNEILDVSVTPKSVFEFSELVL